MPDGRETGANPYGQNGIGVWRWITGGLAALIVTATGAAGGLVFDRLNDIEARLAAIEQQLVRFEEQQNRWADRRKNVRTELDAAQRQIDKLFEEQRLLKWQVCGDYRCQSLRDNG